MFTIEIIYGDGQVPVEEHLCVYTSFIEDPSQFTLNGVSVDLVDARDLLSFVLGVLEYKIPACTKRPLSNLAINLISPLLRLLRQKLCPFSANFKCIKRWDTAFYNALVSSVLHNNSRATWRRLFTELVVNDLDTVPNFDGSKGIVTAVNTAALDMMNAVSCGDINKIKSEMHKLNELSKWISPASILIPTLNDWSLLHLAASAPLPVEIYQFMLGAMECDALQTDRLGRTALHVAAASLNYNAIKVLATKCTASVKMLDNNHQSPLSLLLRCVSMRPWRKWIESHHLQEVIALFVRSNPAHLWASTLVDTSSNSGVRCANIEHAVAKESLFYQAVVYTDDFVAEEVVKLARLTPTSDWNISAIKEALYKCAGRSRDRPATVEILFREIVTPLQDRERIGQEDLLDLVDCSICAAVLSLQHTKHRRDVLKGLLERYAILVQAPASTMNGPEEFDARAAVFVYIAALCGDADLLTFVLASLPRAMVRALMYPPCMQHNTPESDSNTYFGSSFKSKLGRFCNTLESQSMDFAVQSTLSPLSLMCALHRADIVHVMLRACYEVHAHIDTPAGQAAALQAERNHFYPLYWAVLCGASECIRLVHTTLSKESLKRIYFYMSGPEGRSIFQEVLVTIGQNLPHPNPTKHSRATSANTNTNTNTPASLRRLGTTKCYAECLQLVLDCLPAADNKTCGEGPEASAVPLHVGHKAPNHSLPATNFLHTRLAQVEVALDSIRECAAKREWNVEESEQWHAPYSELLAHYAAQKVLTQKVCAELSSTYIQTNLRLICKKFTPDKKWIKLAYCVNRLVRALPSFHALKGNPTVSIESFLVPEEVPAVIDLTSWKAFLSLMSKASKTTELINDLTNAMTSALKDVFTPHALLRRAADVSPEELELFYDQLAAECAVIEQVWNDNQIVVLSRAKSPMPGPYGDAGDANQDLPHYQVNDFKVDQRDVTTYAALQGWLAAMLRSVRDRSDFKVRVLGIHPVTSSAICIASEPCETVLKHIHAQQLRAEKSHIQALLSCAEPAIHLTVSSISYVLTHLATETESPIHSVNQLRMELFYGGLCAEGKASRRREEMEKAKQVEMSDKLMCVLVEFHSRLGGTTESLLSDVLPLCALGLWKASELIVKQASEKGHNLSMLHYNSLKRLLVCNAHAFPSKEAICEALLSPHDLASASSAPNDASIHLLTPLHCAAMHRQGVFIKSFLSAFPDFPVYVASIARCAEGWSSSEWMHFFFAHCSGLQSQVITQNLQTNVWTREGQDEKGNVLNKDVLHLASVATEAAEKLATDSKDPNIVLHPPFTFLRDADVSCHDESPHADSVVLLMNGTQVKWSELVSNPRLLALATPSPQRAGGLFGTGHNILHEAASLPSPDLAFALLNSSLDWRHCILQADKTGSTSLYNALCRGHLELADTMLQYFEHDVSMHKSHILSELCAQQSAPVQKATTTVRESILQKESQQLLTLENKLYIPRVRKTNTEMRGKLTPFYGLRDYAITGPVDVLARYLQGIDLLWKKIQSADPQLLMHVFHYPGCAQLDSVIRARQVMALLGIPLSQLAVPITDAARKLQSAATHRVKDFANLNPQKLKSLVSWPTAVQFRGIVCGWYRQRTVTAPSQLDDTYFLFRNSDVGILDLGRCGTEVGSFLRSNADFQRACDRVRVNGVQPHLRADITSGLEEQLRMEFRFDHSSASRENMLRSGHFNGLNQGASSAVSSAKVNNLLLSMQVDAATCANVLSLSYLILDFARAICVARQLVGITSQPSARTAPALHPLDTLHAQVTTQRAKVEQIKHVLGLHEHEKRPLTSEGVNSTIRICAGLQAADLQIFFRISTTHSVRFAKLRGFVTEGLAAVLLDQGHLQLVEFVCRQALRSEEDASSELAVGGVEIVPQVSSKFSKIVDPELGFELALRALQSLRVLDIINAKGDRMATFVKKYEAQITELVRSSHSEFAMDSAEVQAFAAPDASLNDKIPHILREVSAYATKREQMRSAQKAMESKEKNLQKGYEVAQVMFDLIASVAHLSRDYVLYREDVHQHIINAQGKSPLIALCLQAKLSRKRDTSVPYWSLAEDSARVEAELGCCKRLLSLGASPIVSDTHGRSAIAIAALSGRADMLQVLLEKATRDDLPNLTGYSHLVWHTLLATAGKSPRVGRRKAKTTRSCAELLLLHDFPAEAPPGCDHSSLELAALLQCDAPLLLKLCEARKSVPSAASLLRTSHVLMLRGPRCPLEVVELLLKKVEKSSLTELYSLLGALSDEDFQAQVVHTHAAYLSQLFAPAAMEDIERQACGTIQRALSTIREGRPHVPRHITSTVDVDLAATCNVWRSRALGEAIPAEEETPSDIFELVFSSRNASLVTAVMRHLSDSPFVVNPENKSVYFVPPGQGREEGGAGFLLSQLLCCACVHESSDALELLQRAYSDWQLEGSSSEKPKPVGEEVDKEEDEEEDNEELVSPQQCKAPSWSELLNHRTRCAELGGPTLTPLEVAVQCNSGRCVASLLGNEGVTVTCGLFISAICSSRTDQHTALLLLQHLAADKEHTDLICAEFGDLDSFLTCVDHPVPEKSKAASVEGETVLHLCCRRGYAVLVKHLLELGADPLRIDEHGYSSLEYAVAGGHREVTRLMYPFCSPKIQQAITVLVYMTRKFLLSRGRLRK